MTIDFHTHTYHSYDCYMQPSQILKVAEDRGLDKIVINDHDTIKGGMEAKAINRNQEMEVIVGSEVLTDVGDITGIYLKEEITAKRHGEVIQQIKNQGGIVILNHPFVDHDLSEMNFEGIDLIEGFNSRVSLEKNQKAVELARKLNKPYVAGSDSHLYSDIAKCKTYYDSDDLLSPAKCEYYRNDFFSTLRSQFNKSIKRKDVALFFKLLKYAPKYTYRRWSEKAINDHFFDVN